MELGSRSSAADLPRSGRLIADHEAWWGKKERRLKPHPGLLRWLVRHFKGGNGGHATSKTTRRNRRKLLKRDPATVPLALRLLKDSVARPQWYILEGKSQPDAYLETDDFILVIEGKRTERGQTTTTSWMAGRNQMLRHMDAAAWNAPKGKRVFGLMIVEGDSGDHDWIKDCEAIVSKDVVTKSLPHLGVSARQELARGFLGATTWQEVCKKFNLPWPPVEDEQ